MKSTLGPVDLAATARLDLGLEVGGDVFELLLDEADFDKLFSSGWVRVINDALGCNIDDFEDAHISEPAALQRLILETRYFFSQQEDIFTRIVDLAKRADQCGTGLYFYF